MRFVLEPKSKRDVTQWRWAASSNLRAAAPHFVVLKFSENTYKRHK